MFQPLNSWLFTEGFQNIGIREPHGAGAGADYEQSTYRACKGAVTKLEHAQDDQRWSVCTHLTPNVLPALAVHRTYQSSEVSTFTDYSLTDPTALVR